MEKLTKKEFIESVAERSYLSKKEAEVAIEAVFDTIAAALAEGKQVNIPTFACFTPKSVGERKGMDPNTHEVITLEPKTLVSVRVSKILKDKVNN